MSPEIYELWQQAWCKQNTGRTPPTNKQMNWLMKTFDLTLEDLIQEEGENEVSRD